MHEDTPHPPVVFINYPSPQQKQSENELSTHQIITGEWVQGDVNHINIMDFQSPFIRIFQ